MTSKPAQIEAPGGLVQGYRAMLRAASSLKNLCVADTTRYRRVPFGICKGNYLPLNLRHHTRVLLGLYEIELREIVRQYCRPGLCCYDIGAAYGYYTLALASLCSPGWVFAFDVREDACAVLRETIARNRRLGSEVEVRNACLAGSSDNESNKVTLDHLVFEQGLRAPGLIKMDIDGPEFEVLSGASRVLAECRPKLIIETHSAALEADCKTLLDRAAYTVRIVRNNPLMQEQRGSKQNRWLAAEPS